MPLPIGDYALVGDCHTAALVGRDGSVDWLCLPRFDSASCFGALLGDAEHGRWLLAPDGEVVSSSREYVGDTFVLRTRWVTAEGEVEVLDLMPTGDRRADLLRRVRGIRGTVTMRQDVTFRFGYATALPWVQQRHELTCAPGHRAMLALAGPDAVVLRGPRLHPTDHAHTGTFTVAEGEVQDLTLTWFPSHRPPPDPADADQQVDDTLRFWQDWADRAEPTGPYRQEVRRSLLVLRALTHEDTGGIVAAATTSLPEEFGGQRNWDYRYVWLRDAALTLEALLEHGYADEALEWREWLMRAVAGDPDDVQIMYGLSGERDLPERELASLPGYDGASPVRIGNGAVSQYQADVLGEVLVALEHARRVGVDEDEYSWPLQRALLGFVEQHWERPDNGIWEIRGPQQRFTHSLVMVWAALDRGVRAVRHHGLDGPVERWESLRERVREEIEATCFDTDRGTYTQYAGSAGVDAALLQLPQVGYLDPDDPRMLGTVAAIEDELLVDGFVYRYRTETGVDGLPPGENAFLACSFWLVEQYARSGRVDDARTLMDRLVACANDVGLLAEMWDPAGGRQAGNVPQALSHLALVRAADALDDAHAGRLRR